MVRWDEEAAERKLWLYNKFVVVSIVWSFHAIANLVRPKEPSTLRTKRSIDYFVKFFFA